MSDLYRARLKVVLRITFARRLAKRAGIAMDEALPAPLQDLLDHWLAGDVPSDKDVAALIAYADDLNDRSRGFREQERAERKLAKYRKTLALAATTNGNDEAVPAAGGTALPSRAVMLDRSIGRALRKARVARHLDQTAVAALAGLSLQQIRRCETGKDHVDLDTLWKICSGLGVAMPAMIEQAQRTVVSDRPPDGRRAARTGGAKGG